jgi:hypothetical protein
MKKTKKKSSKKVKTILVLAMLFGGCDSADKQAETDLVSSTAETEISETASLSEINDFDTIAPPDSPVAGVENISNSFDTDSFGDDTGDFSGFTPETSFASVSGNEDTEIDLYAENSFSGNYGSGTMAQNDMTNFSPQNEAPESVTPVSTVQPVSAITQSNNISTGTQSQYSQQYGRSLADVSTGVTSSQGKCGGSNFNRGDCYECTGLALEKATGNSQLFFSGPGAKLNKPPYYAKSFATEWSEQEHSKTFGLTRSFYSSSNYAGGQQAANAAPVGSVIVWDKCGRSPAGHIAIVKSPGVACSSFCAPINNTCGSLAADGSTRVIGVFTPIGRN